MYFYNFYKYFLRFSDYLIDTNCIMLLLMLIQDHKSNLDTLNAAVNDAIDNPKLGLNKNDIPAAYPAGNAYNAESNPFLRHK